MNRFTLIIGNKNYSSWSLRPWLVMRKLGLPFDEIPITLAKEGFKEKIAEAGKQGGELGLVPILIDGETSIWDSLAICEYLAEDHPTLWPKDPAERAIARSMVSEMHSGYSRLRRDMPMNCHAQGRNIEISDRLVKDIERVEHVWKTAMDRKTTSGPWLFGTFSIVDAFFAPLVIRFSGYEVPLKETTQAYLAHWLQDHDLQEWITAGQAETEIIEFYEQVGL